ncbi:hypothetical protein CSA37_04885 [Candidatus Fermentibacteria bacterium]|nr:MAG: hypothetical protein CSA37_10175 [Candidatus Fermentibacteria bacterium]PIE52264.1 MAG: hypothetical protein CSA37_07280 [Candidatus Fermentibacteria bacterium]PIE52759.1 MAG: hypothetical protein CSA37_04885 [Candidatus Fermentibacteria bacterium]
MFLLLLLIIQQPAAERPWQILSGHSASVSAVSPVLELVASGRIEQAFLLWSTVNDPPATRRDLLSAIAWNFRYQLLSQASVTDDAPADMKGVPLEDNCAVVCRLGWMVPRTDGLFHPDEPVTAGDMARLFRFLEGIPDTLNYLPLSMLEDIHLEVR